VIKSVPMTYVNSMLFF